MSLDLLNLPVWSVRPNWAGGITERLEWLTNVLASSSGSEQRQSARLSPRRSLEFTVNPAGRERTFADLFLHRLMSEEMLLPLWHDKARITADAAAGSSVLTFDTSYREHEEEQCVLLYRDAFTYEVAYTQTVDTEGLTTAAPLDRTWPAGTIVYPLRPVRLSVDSNFSALTGRVGQAQLLFTMSRSNDYPADSAMLGAAFQGAPILVTAPNRTESLDQAFQRIIQEVDSETGLRRTLDLAGRSFVTQIHNWTARGRLEHHNLRSLLYYLRGRQRSLWVPTFNDDVSVVRDHAVGEAVLDIENVGYAYTGGAVAGRNRLWSPLRGPMVIQGVGVPPEPGNERLTLSAPITVAIPEATSMSFMDIARMDQDTVEITHHTDIDGVCEIACAFRSFRNARSETPAPVHSVT